MRNSPAWQSIVGLPIRMQFLRLRRLRLASPFVLDLRSIALFRALLGLTMLYDVACRLPYAKLFLSDDGVFSRADHLELISRPWSLSLYMAIGDPLQVGLLLLLHGLAAVALAIGYRTRFAAIVCWALLVSLQHRNPLVLNGGDTLLCLFAFWALFLPLNARFSIDRLLASENDDRRFPPTENRYHAVPGFALFAQIAIVYSFTWALKSGELWRNGEAVSYALHNLGMITKGGSWLRNYTEIHPFLTRLTYHWEWAGLILALCPWKNGVTRLAAIGGFVAMHLSFAATLDLALFPLVSTIGWLALLPTLFWDAVAARARRFGEAGQRWRARLGRRCAAGHIIAPGPLSSFIAAIAIALVFVWNLAGLPDSPLQGNVPQPIENALRLVKLRQKWSMFAANPPRNSTWYAIEAQLVNGDSYDLLYPETLYSTRRPDVFTDRLPDRRWGKFIAQIGKKRYRALRPKFVEYFVQRWNAEVGPDRQIERAMLIGIKERIQIGQDYTNRDARVLETYRAANLAPRRAQPAAAGDDARGIDEPDIAEEDESDAL